MQWKFVQLFNIARHYGERKKEIQIEIDRERVYLSVVGIYIISSRPNTNPQLQKT